MSKSYFFICAYLNVKLHKYVTYFYTFCSQLNVRALVSLLPEMPVYHGSSLLSTCGQVLLTTGGEAVNADNELLLEVASFVPQDKMAVNVRVHEGVISVFNFTQ